MSVEVDTCTACVLSQTAGKAVFGEGHPNPRIVFCAEAPGEKEAETGRPLIGLSGLEFRRELVKAYSGVAAQIGPMPGVYLLNTVKHRPPQNRLPSEEERLACRSFLTRQIKVLSPRIIVVLGKTAAEVFLPMFDFSKMGNHIGSIYPSPMVGLPVAVAYHPRYCLQNLGGRLRNIQLFQEVLINHATS